VYTTVIELIQSARD